MLDNDSNPDGDPLTVNTKPFITPKNGTLDLNSDGSFTYTPNPSFVGTDSFTYQLSGGGLFSPFATVNITVNDLPTTSQVTLFEITEDSGTRRIGQARLLQNASDIEGDPLVATGLKITSGNGTLVPDGPGFWLYTPAANDDTNVIFDYTITDGTDSVTGIATLDITPVNDTPVVLSLIHI